MQFTGQFRYEAVKLVDRIEVITKAQSLIISRLYHSRNGFKGPYKYVVVAAIYR